MQCAAFKISLMLTQQYLSTRGLCRCSCARNHADLQSPPSPHRRFGEIDSSSQSGTAKEEDRKEKETSAHAQGGVTVTHPC